MAKATYIQIPENLIKKMKSFLSCTRKSYYDQTSMTVVGIRYTNFHTHPSRERHTRDIRIGLMILSRYGSKERLRKWR